MTDENSNALSASAFKASICLVRNQQVMLDRDLAKFYQIETRALKQAVKRNSERFPVDFMFQLKEDEVDIMVSQNVIPSRKHLGGSLPYAFTEQGVASLSAVLKSRKAAEIHVQIMRAFVEMRRFLSNKQSLIQRVNTLESLQLKTEARFTQLFSALEDKSLNQDQGIFYDGQIYDAYSFACDLIRSAQKSLIIIDNYVDDSVLTLLSKRKQGVSTKIYTQKISKQLRLDLEKLHQQYAEISMEVFQKAHDRFLIIDEKEVYHIGASLKDLGKKWFAFSKMQLPPREILDKLKEGK